MKPEYAIDRLIISRIMLIVSLVALCLCRPVFALDLVEGHLGNWPRSEAVPALTDLLKGWKKDAVIKKELKAGKKMLVARAQEKAFNFGAAMQIYASVVKGYKGTKTAERSSGPILSAKLVESRTPKQTTVFADSAAHRNGRAKTCKTNDHGCFTVSVGRK